jgi:hypothetical protein
VEHGFEPVYTVHDFYDGRRAGFADFEGVPHACRALWSDELDDWDPESRFELSPSSQEVLALVLAEWAIWSRWEAAFHAGRTTLASHPALPEDAARHAELAPVIKRALAIGPDQRRTATGEFRTEAGDRDWPAVPSTIKLVVRWMPL